MKRLISLLLAAIFVISCSNNNSANSTTPTLPGGGNGSEGPGGNGGGVTFLTSPMLEAAIVDNTLAVSTTPTIEADVNIAASSGPVTNAAITLSGPVVGSLAVTFLGSTSLPVNFNGGVSLVPFGSYTATGWTYAVGEPYTVTASFGGATYTASITAVGNVTVQTGGVGTAVTCSWTNAVATSSANPLNISQFIATNSSNATLYSDPATLAAPYLTSPVTISAFSLTGSVVDVSLTTGTILTSAFPGSFSQSYILSSSQVQTLY